MQVNLDIKKVIMLEVAESVEMKVDEYRHDPDFVTQKIRIL